MGATDHTFTALQVRREIERIRDEQDDPVMASIKAEATGDLKLIFAANRERNENNAYIARLHLRLANCHTLMSEYQFSGELDRYANVWATAMGVQRLLDEARRRPE